MPFFLICGLLSVEERVTASDIQQAGKVQTFSFAGGPPLPKLNWLLLGLNTNYSL